MFKPSTPNHQIRVNQAGYRPSDRKHFVVNGAGGYFEIIDLTNGNVVYTGGLAGPIEDTSSGESIFRGDFTEYRSIGTYSIRIPALGTSYPFPVAEDVYNNVTDALLKSFYFQRCGMDLETPYAGVWSHKACHLAHGTVYGDESEKLPSAGGWHDAGDYGKYTVAAAKAVADLMLAYDCFPFANQERYQAWLDRFGSIEQEAKRIMDDPKKRIKIPADYIGNVRGKRVLNLLGSNGTKAISIALMGAKEVKVVDIAPENARFGMDLARKAADKLAAFLLTNEQERNFRRVWYLLKWYSDSQQGVTSVGSSYSNRYSLHRRTHRGRLR
ncbi:glycoside hydrolase family 9 protein [Paenibacillus harenae]|uniref:glycoside hydrolase family 9 protein n=1 Tax=Paenibacillus harenae TaxID=306543 RepID=UPI00278DC1C2|nr:glycoside hydrolase family 9 protein [Paenibacillus harenae]MDQ0059134.1 hypothetical protein [Paenibacillus harenae]